MEHLPFHELRTPNRLVAMPAEQQPVAAIEWQKSLPMLASPTITLRELRLSDAPALLAMLSSEEVARFISPPPPTVDGFERFIMWAQAERQAGRYMCFGVVPRGMDAAIGVFQIRQLDPGFINAEWGFAFGSAFWGTGLFMTSSRMLLDFTFGVMGIHRMEARAAIPNGRGNRALQKLGASFEGVLRRSLLRGGEFHDQNLWSILAEEWFTRRAGRFVVN